MLHPELRGLLDRLGLADLPCPVNQPFVLCFDEGLRVQFNPRDTGEVWLEANLRPLPQASLACETLLDAALELHRITGPEHEAWLALNHRGKLVLQQTLPTGLGLPKFEALLEDYLNVLEYYQLALPKN